MAEKYKKEQAHNEGIRRLSRASLYVNKSQEMSMYSSTISRSKVSTGSVYDDDDALFYRQRSSSSLENTERSPKKSSKPVENSPSSRPVTPSLKTSTSPFFFPKCQCHQCHY
ncbi:unnamed protein product [Rhizophagus irregularis]|nr:unnamed protein product [Rhizophagus irregularis]